MKIDHTSARIEWLAIHKAGNPAKEKEAIMSQGLSTIQDKEIHDLIRHHIFQVCKIPKVWKWDDRYPDFKTHELADTCMTSNIGQECLECSQELTRLLTIHSNHPSIKEGFLVVAKLSHIGFEDGLIDGLAIVKMERSMSFIHFEQRGQTYEAGAAHGFDPKKIDKVALVLKTGDLYKHDIYVADKTSGVDDAFFWTDDFLRLVRKEDSYFNTEMIIGATKDFIQEHLRPNFEIDKTDEAHILNRSRQFLETQASYDKDRYAHEVFEVEDLEAEWNQFREEEGIDLPQGFMIHPTAFNKQKAIFKSVLKLDKNFHVYIHGDRSQIERGTDEEGRKYYKLYYDHEA